MSSMGYRNSELNITFAFLISRACLVQYFIADTSSVMVNPHEGQVVTTKRNYATQTAIPPKRKCVENAMKMHITASHGIEMARDGGSLYIFQWPFICSRIENLEM